MTFAASFVCFFLSLLLILFQAEGRNDSTCPKSFSCGKSFTNLSFPFSLSIQSECGCDAKPYPRIQLLPGGDWYSAKDILYNYTVWLVDPKLESTLRQHKCKAFDKNFSIPSYSPISFSILPVNIYNFSKCNATGSNSPKIDGCEMYSGCKGFTIYYPNDEGIRAGNLPPANCSLITLPIDSKLYYDAKYDANNLNWLSPEFLVEWKLSDECYECHYSGGQCQTNKFNKFHCQKDAELNRSKLGLTLGIVFRPSHFRWTKTLSNYFKHDVEGGSIFFGVPVFPYSELEEATNDFNSSKVLGDGAFGTVYHGKLMEERLLLSASMSTTASDWDSL